MNNKKAIQEGIYLVVDPMMPFEEVLPKAESSVKAGASVLQIWNNWPEAYGQKHRKGWINRFMSSIRQFEIPVLINEEWELLEGTQLDGVHFDEIPKADVLFSLQQITDRPLIKGLTCGNELSELKKGMEMGFDYFSFCSMFPSSSAGKCEIVSPETVVKARKITDKPLFMSGGITPSNLKDLPLQSAGGIALISGILNADDPAEATKAYKESMNQQVLKP